MTLPTWPQKQCEHYHPEKNDSGNENTFTISSFKFIYPGPAEQVFLKQLKLGENLLFKSLLVFI